MEITIRKDCSAKDTISRIQAILDQINIKLIVSKEVNNEYFHSCRLQIDGLPFGTNGKGVTSEYSLASGYAEFMERFQSGFLLDLATQRNNLLSSENCSSNELVQMLRKFFPEAYNLPDYFDFDSFCRKVPSSVITSEYYNIRTNTIELLPESFISILCGSNGLCAGNTPYEAIAQGMAEIFERIAIKKIYFNNLQPANIPENYYRYLPCYNILQYIAAKNYLYYVKDLTIQGHIPVVGLIIVDPSRKFCQLTAGADLNFDIALQRCITESFQGKRFNISFPAKMKPIIDLSCIDDNFFSLNEQNLTKEYIKQITSNSGIIPLNCLINDNIFDEKNLHIFNNDVNITNRTAVEKLFGIASENKFDVYIKNLSIAGFPTFRVFIPNVCNVSQNLQSVCERAVLSMELKQSIHSKSVNYLELLEIIRKINNIAENPSEFKVSNFTGLTYSKDLLDDTRKIQVVLEIKLGQYKNASDTYKRFFSNDPDLNYILLYINSLANNDNNRITSFFESLNCQQTIDKIVELTDSVNSFDIIFLCNECSSCTKKDFCLNAPKKHLLNIYLQMQKDFCPNIEQYKLLMS